MHLNELFLLQPAQPQHGFRFSAAGPYLVPQARRGVVGSSRYAKTLREQLRLAANNKIEQLQGLGLAPTGPAGLEIVAADEEAEIFRQINALSPP